MKVKEHNCLSYIDWYGIGSDFHLTGSFFHRIDGPAYIEYRTAKKEEVYFVEFYLYDKPFFPWWRK